MSRQTPPADGVPAPSTTAPTEHRTGPLPGQLLGQPQPAAAAGRIVLVVEDDPSIAASLVKGLGREGFTVLHAGTAAMADQLVRDHSVDIVILDLGLPDEDGFSLLRRWQATHGAMPVIVLTANTQLEARLRSLELGAVDWMPKPFWLEELSLRIRLRLDRPEPRAQALRWADAALDLPGRRLTVAGDEVRLSPQEWRLLSFLAQHPGRALTRQKLSEAALDPDEQRGDRAIDTYVARLRRKLGPAGTAIETVWGLGYRFRHG